METAKWSLPYVLAVTRGGSSKDCFSSATPGNRTGWTATRQMCYTPSNLHGACKDTLCLITVLLKGALFKLHVSLPECSKEFSPWAKKAGKSESDGLQGSPTTDP